MDHCYDFMTANQDQILKWTELNHLMNGIRTREIDLRGRIFQSIVDDLTTLGYWMKKLFLTVIEDPMYTESH